MRIRYSPRAAKDLADIHQYLSDRSPRGAASVMAGIYAAVEFVRRNPQAAETTTIRDVRGKVVQKFSFKVFYRVVEGGDVVDCVRSDGR